MKPCLVGCFIVLNNNLGGCLLTCITGSGKTTMLDILAGRKDITSGNVCCPKHVGYVLQSSLLIDSLTVFCLYAPIPTSHISVACLHTPTILFSGIVKDRRLLLNLCDPNLSNR